MRFTGQSVIVTGGAGGLGRAVVAAFLATGARVSVPHRRPGELDDVRAGLPADAAERLTGEVVDLTDEAGVDAYAARVAGASGLDVLVNAAGGFAGGKRAIETPWSVWEQQLSVNLRTAAVACRAAIPRMRERGGAVINVSSRAAVESGEKVAAYSASKSALLQLTRALAAELRDDDVTVNAVLPSIIDTPANRAAMPKADASKWVKPEEIARVILFLAGPDARIVSGAAIPVYGRA